jgi:hypothetical protein
MCFMTAGPGPLFGCGGATLIINGQAAQRRSGSKYASVAAMEGS